MNSTFHARWLASSEVISQVLFTSEQPKENKMAFVTNKVTLWAASYSACVYILKQLFTSVSVKVVNILPPLRWIIVHYCKIPVHNLFTSIGWSIHEKQALTNQRTSLVTLFLILDVFNDHAFIRSKMSHNHSTSFSTWPLKLFKFQYCLNVKKMTMSLFEKYQTEFYQKITVPAIEA